ncbi:MAG: hypothetical protein JXC85_02815 [Candidatus Aenigmarchaeota archaeon]|nr:hypothetical protein [Candidatus Aenigmarchaeota archaeon]
MAAPNPAIGFLEQAGFFTFLSFLLIFIVLYYVFMELLNKYVARLQSTDKKRAISLILSILITAFLFFFFAHYASTGMIYVATAIFVILFLFVVVLAAARVMGLDLLQMLQRKK